MSSVILVIHLIVAVVLIVLILLQRSEGGGLGIGGAGDFMSGRAAGNILSRLTGIFALVFFLVTYDFALFRGYQGYLLFSIIVIIVNHE